jgi:hypothetical protein
MVRHELDGHSSPKKRNHKERGSSKPIKGIPLVLKAEQ